MKCLACLHEGRTSRISIGTTTTTLMWSPPFYDEDGVYHCHDFNTHATTHTCSNGHSWSETRRTPCPAEGCDFR